MYLEKLTPVRQLLQIANQNPHYISLYLVHLRTSPKVPITRNFKKFIFVLEHEDAEYSYSEDQADRVGNLAIIDPLTTFNKKCRNSLVETNDLPKPEVRVSNKNKIL